MRTVGEIVTKFSMNFDLMVIILNLIKIELANEIEDTFLGHLAEFTPLSPVFYRELLPVLTNEDHTITITTEDMFDTLCSRPKESLLSRRYADLGIEGERRFSSRSGSKNFDLLLSQLLCPAILKRCRHTHPQEKTYNRC